MAAMRKSLYEQVKQQLLKSGIDIDAIDTHVAGNAAGEKEQTK